MDEELDVTFRHHDGYIDLPDGLADRMLDVVKAVAAGAYGPAVRAEAVLILDAVARAVAGMLDLEHDEDEW